MRPRDNRVAQKTKKAPLPDERIRQRGLKLQSLDYADMSFGCADNGRAASATGRRPAYTVVMSGASTFFMPTTW